MEATRKTRLVVLGGGVAGSIYTYLVLRRWKECKSYLRVYEVGKTYNKPCGEALPLGTIDVLARNGIPLPPILTLVNEYLIAVNDSARLYKFDKPIWAIIDKHGWINNLRRKIKNTMHTASSSTNIELLVSRAMKGELPIVVDARGPYANPENTIPVWQAYAYFEWPNNRAALFFKLDEEFFGLAWIFPYSKGVVNIGGGFTGIARPKPRALQVIEEVTGSRVGEAIIQEKHSIITVKPRINLGISNYVAIGEAAGLIMPLGGEGIRPAVISAIAAYLSTQYSESCEEIGFDQQLYRYKLRKIAAQVKLQKLVLSIASKHPRTSAHLLESIDSKILRAWLAGRITGFEAMRLLFRLPRR